jgi:hypothetical protein
LVEEKHSNNRTLYVWRIKPIRATRNEPHLLPLGNE